MATAAAITMGLRRLVARGCPASSRPAVLGIRRCASQPAEPPPQSDLSATANSYISLGAFETMGSDVGRMATGISYLSETVQVQQAEYEAEADPRRRATRALGLAQNLMQVGRQHHQQQDPGEAIGYYQRAIRLIEDSLAFREQNTGGKSRKAIEYARFILSEVCNSIGVAYNDLGRQDDALEALQRALTLRKETVGKEHPSVAECLNNLGALFFARGALQRAVEHYEQALELLVAAAEGRQEGAYAALTLYNIGVCRSGLGQAEASVVALKRALRIAEQALGTDHRQVELIRETLRKGPAAAQGASAQPGSEP